MVDVKILRRSAQGWKRPVRIVALALGCLIAAAGLRATASDASPTISQFDGRTLFSGLIFGQGPASHVFWAEFREFPKPDAAFAAQADRVVAAIDAADPAFFAEFERLVSSGRHHLVREGLQRGAERVVDVLAEEWGVNRAGALDRLSAAPDGMGVAAIFLVVIVVIAALWLYLKWPIDSAPGALASLKKHSNLSLDRYIDSIVRAT